MSKLKKGDKVEFYDKKSIKRNGVITDIQGCNITIKSGRILKRSWTVRSRFVKKVQNE